MHNDRILFRDPTDAHDRKPDPWVCADRRRAGDMTFQAIAVCPVG